MPSRTSQDRFRPSVVLEHVDDAQALLVVIEAAGDQIVEDALAGVAERRVAEIVAKGNRFGELLVQPKHLGDAARDLRNLQRVRQPRPVVVAGRRKEHLRLVLEAAERLAVDDPIAIALKRGADGILCLGAQPAARVGALGRLRRENVAFPLSSCSRMRHRVRPAARHRKYISPRKLVPCSSGPTPNSSASVCPRSANVVRVPISVPGLDRRPVKQHRHVLARMVGARRRRVVAVIGGDHQEVVVDEGAAAAPPAGRRTARDWRRIRRFRCGARRRCRNPRGWRRSDRPRRCIADSISSMP